MDNNYKLALDLGTKTGWALGSFPEGAYYGIGTIDFSNNRFEGRRIIVKLRTEDFTGTIGKGKKSVK